MTGQVHVRACARARVSLHARVRVHVRVHVRVMPNLTTGPLRHRQAQDVKV